MFSDRIHSVYKVAGAEVADKVYDGTTDATVAKLGEIYIAPDEQFIVADDVYIESATASFDKKDARSDAGALISFTLGGKDAANYEVLDARDFADILQAPVVVKANNATKAAGQKDPELGATVTGAIAGEENLIVYAVSRDAGEEPGTYAIHATGEASQGNYLVSYEDATFTITAVTPAATPTTGDSTGAFAMAGAGLAALAALGLFVARRRRDQ